jgi:hypothetical protein
MQSEKSVDGHFGKVRLDESIMSGATSDATIREMRKERLAKRIIVNESDFG